MCYADGILLNEKHSCSLAIKFFSDAFVLIKQTKQMLNRPYRHFARSLSGFRVVNNCVAPKAMAQIRCGNFEKS